MTSQITLQVVGTWHLLGVGGRSACGRVYLFGRTPAFFMAYVLLGVGGSMPLNDGI